MRASFVLLASTSIALAAASEGSEDVYTDEFVVNVSACEWSEVHKELELMDASFIKKILPDFYLYKDNRTERHKEDFSSVIMGNILLQTKVKHFERIRGFTMDSFDGHIIPAAMSSNDDPGHIIAAAMSSNDNPVFTFDSRNCPTFSDMGVEAVWKMGYTGKGVVIAITDAGINTDISDIQPNIKSELSYNYAANSSDVTPDRCYVSDRYNSLSDHGNNCAGVVAACRNELCGDGVAFQAGLVAITIFDILHYPKYERCRIHSETSWMAQGLVHAIEHVDVYSNSWGANENFRHGSELVTNSLQTGVSRGRNGKGAIYVFPVGPMADPYANSVHTIAVNSVDSSGHVSSFSEVCACTLTSAYGQPSKRGPRVMRTTSNYRGKCTLEFEGTSASTAIVSGIIGLAIQANPKLGWRDIQDLIVQASETRSLVNKKQFVRNGAGKKYHYMLGFGLLNAAKFVKLARTAKSLTEQLILTRHEFRLARSRHPYSPLVECSTRAHIDVSCTSTCINRTESVLIHIQYSSLFEYNSDVILTSPSGTESLLLNQKQDVYNSSTYRHKDILLKSVNFWGENAEGIWTLTFQHRVNQGEIRLEMFKLRIYGTGYTKAFATSEPFEPGHDHGSGDTSSVAQIGTNSPEETLHNISDDDSVWLTYVATILGVVAIICIAVALLIINIKRKRKSHYKAIGTQ